MKYEIALMFHDVKGQPSRWNTTPARFKEIIDRICIHAQVSNICITVDDGGKGNYEFICPILESRGLRARFFVPTQYIANNPRSTYMSAIQIREISDNGHVIGSHSHTHPRNISLLNPEFIQNEWRISKDILEQVIGRPVTECSIPGGFYSRAQLSILCQLGYLRVFNSIPRYGYFEENGMFVHGRFSIDRSTSDSTLERLLLHDRRLQVTLYLRQKLSQQIYSLKHRLNIFEIVLIILPIHLI